MKPAMSINDACFYAANLIMQSDGLLITAGAGMGIDSGLPDFRGDHGFWKAYPALGAMGKSFSEIANPSAFVSMPRVAWGFYGHRLKLYRETQPHAGFAQLLTMASRVPHGAWVFTSNVDGQFQKAGFAPDRVTECHGSIHYLQCLYMCGEVMWKADAFLPEVDVAQCLLESDLPTCPACGGLARPNIMMFGDWHWDEMRWAMQDAKLRAWLKQLKHPVVIELGAGTAIPTVRLFGQRIGCPMIRINPTEAQVKSDTDLSIALGALDGVTRIGHMLESMLV